MSQFSNLPLQDMIAGVIRNATEKLAEDANPFAKSEKSSTDKSGKTTNKTGKTHATDKSAKTEKTAALTDPDYIEKLASAVEYINANMDGLLPQNQGVLQSALTKMAARADQVGAGRGATSLETNEAGTKGRQKYTKNKPAGEDASKSEANAPMGTHGLPGGSTLVHNDMEKAPGQASGSVPTARYPEKGPLVALGKQASIRDYYAWALSKTAKKDEGETEYGRAKRYGRTGAGLGAGISAASHALGSGPHHRMPGGIAGLAGSALGGGVAGYGLGRLTHRVAHGPVHEGRKVGKSKTASAQEIILQKLAGEDVMKANINGGGTTSPLAGMGQLTTTMAGQASPHQAGDHGGGFGNEARKHIGSNASAINYTKRDAKGPVKKQLREVLDEPALSAKHDNKLQENLRSTGQAGVKIAAARAFLSKIAEEGCTCNDSGECKYCKMKSAISSKSEKSKTTSKTKTAETATIAGGGPAQPPNPLMGSSGGKMGEAGEGSDGCTCGNAGECRVCKLKAALAAAQSEGGRAAGGGGPMGGGEQQQMQGKDI